MTDVLSRPVLAPGRLRLGVCLATVLACLPYLLLKVAWVAGWAVGVSGGGSFTDTTRGANVLTAGLEVAAIALAVAFVAPLGRRLPAAVVLLPVWVASGLLTPVALGVVVGAPLQLLSSGTNPFVGDEVLAPWVFALVYGGFSLQAVLLLTGFVLFARERWPVVARGGGATGGGVTRSLQDHLGGGLAVAATLYAAVQVATALSGGGRFTEVTTTQRVVLVGVALLAVATAWASVRLLRGAPLTPRRVVVLWVGSAVVFTDALSQTLTTVAIEPGAWGATDVGPGPATLMLLVLLAALGGAIGGAMRLVEENGADPVA